MLDGIIVIDKEPGYTSHDVVAKMRGICGQKKVGHTGTLDPDATGVLPICLGKGTKVSGLLTDSDKVYEAELVLGITTDTLDLSGKILSEREVDFLEEEVKEAIYSFVGEIFQIPPMYSALKVNGQKLCDLARQGIEVERKPRKVKIYSIDILSMELPKVIIRVACSKGTYIRTLCQDIGDKLGCGGAMGSLRRIRAAGFTLEHAITLTELQKAKDAGHLTDYLHPVEEVYSVYPRVTAKSIADKLLQNGNVVPAGWMEKPASTVQMVRMYNHQGDFIGIFSYKEETKEYRPVKMFYCKNEG
ncbi:MAG: tRNA pseudouridine(55) synthase TruB [Lachnospiraceae bacterium]|jgi:tRNA pseudouridine55 synthase|nr:tRNA pseudouridine(55) synthase TruB [Lachnospiraceae bacterium]